jgi:hypothetical protein
MDDVRERRGRYIIFLKLSGRSLDESKERLRKAGIELDESFPEVTVDGSDGGVVIRGLATRSTIDRAEDIEEARFFPDLGISPA